MTIVFLGPCTAPVESVVMQTCRDRQIAKQTEGSRYALVRPETNAFLHRPMHSKAMNRLLQIKFWQASDPSNSPLRTLEGLAACTNKTLFRLGF